MMPLIIKEPWFWYGQSFIARVVRRLLSPLGALYNTVQKQRWARVKPAPAPVPVLCIGAVAIGGAGKTPFAGLLFNLLRKEGLNPHFLMRGYGGRLKGPLQVNLDTHNADDVGDEALMLAALGPVWTSADRVAGANAAAQNGADIIIMDDGFQNPSLEKSLSFLLLDAAGDAGSIHVFPAGPYREPVDQAIRRADMIVAVKQSADAPVSPAITQLACGVNIISVWPDPKLDKLPPQTLAFCGIGRPHRFFQMLKACDVTVVDAIAFPDHHPYSAADMMRLRNRAKQTNASLVTTQKDYVRLPEEERKDIIPIHIDTHTDKPDMILDIIHHAMTTHAQTHSGPHE